MKAKGLNFLLQASDQKTPQLKIKNIYNQEDDILLDVKRTNEERIVLSRPDKGKLKKYALSH